MRSSIFIGKFKTQISAMNRQNITTLFDLKYKEINYGKNLLVVKPKL